jgi:D5 N terminal like
VRDANDIARERGPAALRKIIDANATARPPAYSDEALALRFAERHAADRRFVAAFGKWFIYDGVRWGPDETLDTFDRIRHICRETAAQCKKKGLSISLASASTATAVERLARSDRRLAAKTEQWDTDPWLLTTPTGVVDLRTGQIRPHRQDDFITKLAGVAPDARCAIPTWHRFLDRVFGGDAGGAPIFRYGSGSSDVLHALLDHRVTPFRLLVGHSKGALQINNAMRSLPAERTQGLRVVTLGCPIGENVAGVDYHQYLGLFDALGQLNAWGHWPDYWPPTWHSTNPVLPPAMAAGEITSESVRD